MIVYSLLALTLFCATACLFILWRTAGKPWPYYVPSLLLSASLGIFIYLYGTWIFLSVYTKYVFAFCFLIVLVAVVFRTKSFLRPKPLRWHLGLQVLFTLIFTLLSILYFTGTTGKPYGIANLAFPLRHGNYLVLQGGKGLPTNIFHYGLRGAVYAMDITKLNKAGNRANHIFSARLGDYEIFNDTIYSPCKGIVVKTENDNPDNIPPNHERGPTNTNLVLIDEGSFYIFMAHMRKGSVMVHAGDSLYAGQPVGRVGNSGFSLEPHLHIQVQAKTDINIPWYREKPLLIKFDGKGYLLFEQIRH